MSEPCRIKGLAAMLALLGFLGAFPCPVEAGEEAGCFSLSVFLGIVPGAELGRLHPLPNTADVPPVTYLMESRSPEWGARLGCVLARSFSVELGVEFAGTEIMEDVGIGFAGIPLGKHAISNAVIWALGGRALFRPAVGRTKPYVFAGCGIATLDTRDIGRRSRPMVEFGAGLSVGLAGKWRAFFEVRDAVYFFRFFEDFRIATVLIYSAESRGVQHRPGARLGIEFYY